MRLLQGGLKERGFNIGENQLLCHSRFTCMANRKSHPVGLRLLRENYHVFCSIVIYPVIPKGMIILRLIPTASHTDEDIQITLMPSKQYPRNYTREPMPSIVNPIKASEQATIDK
ncbi:MAG: hypothetical protein R2806_23730 [Saprospiraceae bacterium]